MESYSEENAAKFRQACALIEDHNFMFVKSMSLKCAVDLGIPDIIHNYGKLMPLSQLIATLPIHPSKTCFIHRLMRMLTHSGFFTQHNVTKNEQEVRYALTDESKLLLKDHPFSMKPITLLTLDPIMINPFHQLSTWLKNEDPTPFHTEHGMAFFDYFKRDTGFSHLYSDAMAKDTRFVANVMIENHRDLFNGLESVVDVGGGTGTMIKAIAKSFPQLKCTVFDLPNVVADVQGTENIKYVGGNMFEAIPSADSIMLKWVLHCWNDDDSVKILKKCREAIPSHGKVIIIDFVMEDNKEDMSKLNDMVLCDDMLMMSLFAAKNRSLREWTDLITFSGFSNYKITLIFDLYYIIEAYP